VDLDNHHVVIVVVMVMLVVMTVVGDGEVTCSDWDGQSSLMIVMVMVV
jgi:hypothetical protein